MDPAKLKVVELRAELANRGLDQKGVKATLVTRLQAALDEEAAGGVVVRCEGGEFSAPVLDNSFNDEPSDGDTSSVAGGPTVAVDPLAGTPVPRRRRTRSMTRSPSPVKTDLDVQQQPPLDTLNEEDSDCSPPPRKIPATPSRATPSRRRRSVRSTTRSPSPVTKPEVPKPLAAVAEEEPPVEEVAAEVQTIEEEEAVAGDAVIADEAMDDDAVLNEDEEMPEVEAKSAEDAAADKEESNATTAVEDNGDNTETGDEKKSEETAEDKPKEERSTSESKSSPSKPQQRPEVNLKKPERSTQPRVVEFTNVETEPDLPESGIYLSWMDSDLHLLIDSAKDCLEARPIHESHLLSAYSGCRATHGVRTGRVAYEVHIASIIHTNQYDPPKYDIRVGWSTRSTSLQLGEGPLSFGYTMQRKKALASVFTEYGMLLRTGDVVGVYLDLESEPCRVEYTVNGKQQGVAFEFERSELGDAALYPHVLSKCVAFRCNFSDSDNLLVNTTQPEFTEPDEKHERRMIAPKPLRSKKTSDSSKENTSGDKEKSTEEDAAKEATSEGAEAKPEDVDPSTEDVEQPKSDEATAAADDKPEPIEIDETNPETVVEEPAQPEPVPEEAAATDEAAASETEAAVAEEPIADETTTDKPEAEAKEVAPPVVPRVIYDLLPDYVLIGQVDAEQLVAGPTRPATRQECEVIMMIGLPGSGKTTWALNYAKEHEDKNFYLLSQATIMDRTTFNGKPRYVPRSKNWEHALKYYLRTLERLYLLAHKRRRNFIIDEPNVTFEEQKKRIKGFGDFTRTAVVVIPTQDDLKERSDKKEAADGRTYNRSYLADMKVNFEVPDADCLFNEIRYAELDEAQSADILQEYYKEGQLYKSSRDYHRDRYPADKYRQPRGAYPNNHHQPHWQGNSQPRHHRGGGGASNYRHGSGGAGGGHQRDDYRSPAPYWRGGGGGGGSGGGGGANRHYGGSGGGFDHHRDRWNGGGGGGGGGVGSGGSRNWVLNNRGGGHGGGGGGGNRYEDRGYRGSHQQPQPAAGGYQRRDYSSAGGFNNGGSVGGTYNNYRGGATDRRGDDRSYRGGGGGQRDHRDFRDGNRDRHTGDRTKNDRGVPHYNKDDKMTKNYGSTNTWNQSVQQGTEDWSSYYQQHQQPQNYYGQQASAWQQQTPAVADNQQYWSDSSWQQSDASGNVAAVAAGTDQTQQQGWQNWSQYAQTYGNVDPSVGGAYKK